MTNTNDRAVQLTARGLQEALVDDLNELFKNDWFKTPDYLTPEELGSFEPEDQVEEPAARGHHKRHHRRPMEGMQMDIHQHRMATPKAYPQALPLRETNSPMPPPEDDVDDECDDEEAAPPPPPPDDEETDPFPYIIVRLDGGGIASQTDPHKIAVILLIGIFDDDPINQGHVAVMEIIERIQHHYMETPVLGAFAVQDPIHWYLQDEESYPYYFGAVDMTFSAPAPRITAVEDLV